ncbi:hypothetical protein O181_049622 [Austropuccinia psidii MF-1]|uniref:Uncharacterized protein n=1 Tax=Austropuccinia psidii MF-1 TaxID=1389203 RepID=A0A9Q3HMT0_9BASI|nr:hypothetical protein [Austropuccinia psidii MF-1]
MNNLTPDGWLLHIPTSASGSECPQIILDQIFPADYSQFTKITFSTPLGLTSTAQKPYRGSPNLPSQDLGMIISAILSLRYNIPCRASPIFNPALNLLIKSSISSSGGHPLLNSIYLKISVPYLDISNWSQLFKTIYVFLNVSFLISLLNLSQLTNPTVNTLMTQMIMIPLAHNHLANSSVHLNPTPKAQPTSKKIIPTKHFLYQPFKNWPARFLQLAGIMEILHQHQQSQIPEGSPKC